MKTVSSVYCPNAFSLKDRRGKCISNMTGIFFFPSGIHLNLFFSSPRKLKNKTDFIVLSVNSRQ